jgi:hypothetical protein
MDVRKILSDAFVTNKENWRTEMHTRIMFNLFIFTFNLILIPSVTYGIWKILIATNFSKQMADGLMIAACLPITTTGALNLTKKTAGDISTANFHNFIGILISCFLTPLMMILFLTPTPKQYNLQDYIIPDSKTGPSSFFTYELSEMAPSIFFAGPEKQVLYDNFNFRPDQLVDEVITEMYPLISNIFVDQKPLIREQMIYFNYEQIVINLS